MHYALNPVDPKRDIQADDCRHLICKPGKSKYDVFVHCSTCCDRKVSLYIGRVEW